MRIDVEEFKLTLNNSEMWDIAHALRMNIKRMAEHSTKHNGIHTFNDWIKRCTTVSSFECICLHLGRPDYYNDIMKEARQVIADAEQEK